MEATLEVTFEEGTGIPFLIRSAVGLALGTTIETKRINKSMKLSICRHAP